MSATRLKWKRFIFLKRGEHFFIGRKLVEKTGFSGCQVCGDPSLMLINPFHKVRTLVPVKKQAAAPESQGEHGFSPRTPPCE